MDDSYCSLCGAEIKNKDMAYGLTRGIIDEGSFGFRMDSDSAWDVYCAGCMNEIDKLLANFRQMIGKTKAAGSGLKD